MSNGYRPGVNVGGVNTNDMYAKARQGQNPLGPVSIPDTPEYQTVKEIFVILKDVFPELGQHNADQMFLMILGSFKNEEKRMNVFLYRTLKMLSKKYNKDVCAKCKADIFKKEGA